MKLPRDLSGTGLAGKDQPCLDELAECVAERLAVHRRHGIEQRPGEFPANDRCKLGDLHRRAEVIEPGQQAVVQGFRNRQGRLRAAQDVAIGRFLDETIEGHGAPAQAA